MDQTSDSDSATVSFQTLCYQYKQKTEAECLLMTTHNHKHTLSKTYMHEPHKLCLTLLPFSKITAISMCKSCKHVTHNLLSAYLTQNTSHYWFWAFSALMLILILNVGTMFMQEYETAAWSHECTLRQEMTTPKPYMPLIHITILFTTSSVIRFEIQVKQFNKI
jgi:predicted GIY-YIG superfamily endonuclease